MEQYDPRIDTYIEKSADFAKPILIHLRKLIHRASSEMRETIKWGFPHFDYKGTICSMASFKEHCAFGFWKSSLLSDPYSILKKESKESMGQLGRIKSIASLPSDEIITAYILEAISLNEKGIKLPKKAGPVHTVNIPDYFQKTLNDHADARTHFEKLSNSHRKEYISWIEEAKTDATRNKRISTTLEWLNEGKSLNWKYERKS